MMGFLVLSLGCSSGTVGDSPDSGAGLAPSGNGGTHPPEAPDSGSAGGMQPTADAQPPEAAEPRLDGAAPPVDVGGGDGAVGDDGDAGDGAVSPDGPVASGANVRMNDDNGTAGHNEVSMAAVNKLDGAIVAGWNDRRTGVNRCAFTVSRDGGKTWDANIVVASLGKGITGDPTVTVDEAGNLYVVCMDYGTNQIRMSHSTDAGVTWSPWRVVRGAPDKPWIAGVRDGTLYLTWLGSPGGFSRSLDRGMTWEPMKSLGAFNGGTAISVGNGGLVHIAYVQGGSMLYVRSKDYGETLEPGRNLGPVGRFCFNCTPRNFAITGSGSDVTGQIVAVTWSSTLMVNGSDGDDDVWVMVSKDGGDNWTPVLRANSNTTPSRQFQSSAAVDASGAVRLTWTDFRNGGLNATYVATARDPYTQFGPNIEITDTRAKPPNNLGDYKAIVIQGTDALVGWTDARRGHSDVYFARVPLARF